MLRVFVDKAVSLYAGVLGKRTVNPNIFEQEPVINLIRTDDVADTRAILTTMSKLWGDIVLSH